MPFDDVIMSKAKILVVDDEAAVRKLVIAILDGRYDCKCADSAETALEMVDAERFDLVITDVSMGAMNGIDLIARIHEDSPDTVSIIISGNQAIESAIEAMRSGAFDFIQKPFNLDQVNMAVDRAVEHAKLLASKRIHESELEQLVEQRTADLHYLAFHDPLTGLANRRYFEDQLTHLMNRRSDESRVAVVLISLDRFKRIRDTLNESTSDSLIVEAAKHFESIMPKNAVLARVDGHEFAVMMTISDSIEVTELAETIIDSVERPFNIGDYDIFVTVSLGISQTNGHATDGNSLIKTAGSALSQAKKHTGNSFQFYSYEFHERDVKRLALENDLRHALERGEFEVYCQPKVDFEGSTVVGMEALIRWNHPIHGLVPPDSFIPIAEETGLIIPIGEWMMRAACAESKRLLDKGIPVNVAVNLSPGQFHQKGLARRIRDILAETGLSPTMLNIEVTESSIMNSPELAIEVLNELRLLGIKISLDDFGTGYSSLSHLKELPVDVLKIDKSFIKNVTDDPDDAALVLAIISLAHNLRLTVVAEGVETEEQLRFLRLLRCDEWQGYLFSKPVNIPAFEELVSRSGGSHFMTGIKGSEEHIALAVNSLPAGSNGLKASQTTMLGQSAMIS